MKTIHTRAGILLVPLLALALAGCNGSSEAVEASKMSTQRSDGYVVIDRNNREIGTVRMSDGKIDVPFSFQNGGDEALALLEGSTSCMCTEAVVRSADGIVSPRLVMKGHSPVTARVNQVLEPGETAELVATFDPNAHGPAGTGPFMRDILLRTNAAKTPTVIFRFSGTVVP